MNGYYTQYTSRRAGPSAMVGTTTGDGVAAIMPRTTQQRRDDVLARLATDRDLWLATADVDGRPHVVPLALCWDGQRLIVRVKRTSRTARNATKTGRARVAMGTTRDVVMIDAAVEWVPVDDAPETAALYAARTGWASRPGADGVFLLLSPVRIQAWQEADEFAGRTVMDDGGWAP